MQFTKKFQYCSAFGPYAAVFATKLYPSKGYPRGSIKTKSVRFVGSLVKHPIIVGVGVGVDDLDGDGVGLSDLDGVGDGVGGELVAGGVGDGVGGGLVAGGVFDGVGGGLVAGGVGLCVGGAAEGLGVGDLVTLGVGG
jgi:hypothetical protein